MVFDTFINPIVSCLIIFHYFIVLHGVEKGNPRADSDEESGMK